MRASIRKVILFTVLTGVAAYVAFDFAGDGVPTGGVPSASTTPGGPGVEASSPQGAASGERAGRLALPDRLPLGEPRAELFGPHSWQPPAPRIAAAPPAPTAPPMPYRYAGKLVEGDRLSVLLARGDTVFPIKEGETLDGAYRVEAIGETQVTLIYLPLKRRESIPVFSSLPAGPAAAAAAAPAAGSPSGGAQAESGPARLLWEGPRQVKLGTRFEVALRVTSGQPLHASPMQLRFDPAYLEFVSAKPGKLFGGGDRNFSYRANPDGSIFVGASSRNPVPVSDAELLVLTFLPVKPSASAELNIASLSLQGAAGRPIAFSRFTAYKTVISP